MRILDAGTVEAKPGDPAYFTGAVVLRPLGGTAPPRTLRWPMSRSTIDFETEWLEPVTDEQYRRSS